MALPSSGSCNLRQDLESRSILALYGYIAHAPYGFFRLRPCARYNSLPGFCWLLYSKPEWSGHQLALLHEGIIPFDIWERVQHKLEEQTVARTEQTKRRDMLQGLIYDSEGSLYSPTFTKRHDRQYCYYISRSFVQDRGHPDGGMARLPAHEIEVLIEKALRDQINNFCTDVEERTFKYILEHHENIPDYDLVRTCVVKIMVSPDLLTIYIKPEGFRKLADKHLKVDIPGIKDAFEISVPFKVGKTKKGAIVIQPDGTKEIFDLPPPELKKLVQGIVWRGEHFAGRTLTEIACREGCSDAHVGKCIMASFDLLQAA